jgi:hypothetical protein
VSIWSTIAAIKPLWTVGYGPPGGDRSSGDLGASQPIDFSDLDIASATPWYGGTGVRLWTGWTKQPPRKTPDLMDPHVELSAEAVEMLKSDDRPRRTRNRPQDTNEENPQP